MTITKRTNGANDAEWDYWCNDDCEYKDIKISDYYEMMENDPYKPREPELSFKCKESAVSWIKKQNTIIGCMYNLYDEEILELLAERSVQITVNYDAEMGGDAYRMKIAKKWYPRITFEPKAKASCGINVFRHKEGKYERNMHHKFLLGWEQDPEGTPGLSPDLSLFYGTYNMSHYSPHSLDSVLIFRENMALSERFIKLACRISLASIPYELLPEFEYDYDKAHKSWKRAKRMYEKNKRDKSREPTLSASSMNAS